MSNTSPTAPPLSSYTPVNAAVIAKRTTITLIIMAALIALFGGFGFFLINGQIQDQLKAESDRQSQVGSAQQIAKRDASAHSGYAAVQSQLKYVSDPVDVKSYVPTLLPQIESAAKSYGLQVSSITPGAMSALTTPTAVATPAPTPNDLAGLAAAPTALPVATYQTMSLSINLSGPYRQVMKFIYSMTRFPKVLSIKQIGLHPTASGNPTGPDADKVNVTLQMVAYVFTPQSQAGQTAQTSASPAAKPAAAPAPNTAPVPDATPAEARPMHAAMAPPTLNSPLPTPNAIKSLSGASLGTVATTAPSGAHK